IPRSTRPSAPAGVWSPTTMSTASGARSRTRSSESQRGASATIASGPHAAPARPPRRHGIDQPVFGFGGRDDVEPTRPKPSLHVADAARCDHSEPVAVRSPLGGRSLWRRGALEDRHGRRLPANGRRTPPLRKPLVYHRAAPPVMSHDGSTGPARRGPSGRTQRPTSSGHSYGRSFDCTGARFGSRFLEARPQDVRVGGGVLPFVVTLVLGLSGVATAGVFAGPGSPSAGPPGRSDKAEANEKNAGVHGGPIERFHNAESCDLTTAGHLRGLWP